MSEQTLPYPIEINLGFRPWLQGMTGPEWIALLDLNPLHFGYLFLDPEKMRIEPDGTIVPASIIDFVRNEKPTALHWANPGWGAVLDGTQAEPAMPVDISLEVWQEVAMSLQYRNLQAARAADDVAGVERATALLDRARLVALLYRFVAFKKSGEVFSACLNETSRLDEVEGKTWKLFEGAAGRALHWFDSESRSSRAAERFHKFQSRLSEVATSLWRGIPPNLRGLSVFDPHTWPEVSIHAAQKLGETEELLSRYEADPISPVEAVEVEAKAKPKAPAKV